MCVCVHTCDQWRVNRTTRHTSGDIRIISPDGARGLCTLDIIIRSGRRQCRPNSQLCHYPGIIPTTSHPIAHAYTKKVSGDVTRTRVCERNSICIALSESDVCAARQQANYYPVGHTYVRTDISKCTRIHTHTHIHTFTQLTLNYLWQSKHVAFNYALQLCADCHDSCLPFSLFVFVGVQWTRARDTHTQTKYKCYV